MQSCHENVLECIEYFSASFMNMCEENIFSVTCSDDIRYIAMRFGLHERSLDLNCMGQMLLLGYGNAVPIKKKLQEVQ